MRFSQLALTAAVSCFAASAYAAPVPGSVATVGGRAHIEQLADGTHIILDGRSDVSGFVAFDNKSTFPNIDKLDGRKVQIRPAPVALEADDLHEHQLEIVEQASHRRIVGGW